MAATRPPWRRAADLTLEQIADAITNMPAGATVEAEGDIEAGVLRFMAERLGRRDLRVRNRNAPPPGIPADGSDPREQD